MSVLGFLTGPATGLINAVGGVIDKVAPNEVAKLEARGKLLEIERSFHRQVLLAEADIAKAQAEVIKAEAGSSSWLARNWRPLLMLTFTYIIAHNYVISPIFGITSVPIPVDMWELLKLGMGGYIIGRSAEKIAPTLLEVAKKK